MWRQRRACAVRGTVEKRGSSYSIRFDMGRDPATGRRKQKRISGFKTRKEAEAALAKLIAEHEQGVLTLPTKMTLGEFLHRWFELKKEHLAFTTARQYEGMIRHHILPALGHIPLARLTPLKIQEFLHETLHSGRRDNKVSYGGRLATTTVNYVYRVLRAALRTAVEWGLIPRNPADAVKPPPARHDPPVVLPPAEVTRLLEGLKGSYLYLPAYLAVWTGMRLGEILALRWEDVDLEAGIAYVRRTLPQQSKKNGYVFKEPKTENSARVVKLPPSVVETLKKEKARQEELKTRHAEVWTDYGLVCCLEDGSPIHPTTVSSAFPKVAARLGFKLKFHDLRDVYAGLLLQAGVHVRVVSAALGHSDPAVTVRRYMGVSPAMLGQVAESVEELIVTNS